MLIRFRLCNYILQNNDNAGEKRIKTLFSPAFFIQNISGARPQTLLMTIEVENWYVVKFYVK